MVPIISFNYRPYNNDGTLKTSTEGAKAEMERDFEIDYYRVWTHMRIVTREANFNSSGRFGLSEIEIGTDLEPAQFSLPEYGEPEIPAQQQLPDPNAHWAFEEDTLFTDIIAGSTISQYTDSGDLLKVDTTIYDHCTDPNVETDQQPERILRWIRL